eukprot:3330200-Pyramimonas_sp.AAC.1
MAIGLFGRPPTGADARVPGVACDGAGEGGGGHPLGGHRRGDAPAGGAAGRGDRQAGAAGGERQAGPAGGAGGGPTLPLRKCHTCSGWTVTK